MSSRQQFRYYSRRILQSPNEFNYHEQRIQVAMEFVQNEPLQGALVDMFYGCWYEIPLRGAAILTAVDSRLTPRIREAFDECIHKLRYIERISEFATRWSVLVTPSLNVAIHQLCISSDDARQIASDVSDSLIRAQADNDWQRVTQIETDFFGHCLACVDRIGFSLVWFRLAKYGWIFDERWRSCQQYLEQLPNEVKAMD